MQPVNDPFREHGPDKDQHLEEMFESIPAPDTPKRPRLDNAFAGDTSLDDVELHRTRCEGLRAKIAYSKDDLRHTGDPKERETLRAAIESCERELRELEAAPPVSFVDNPFQKRGGK